MEGFVPKNAQNDGVYQYLESGDFVEINYIVLNDDYRGKDGKMVYNTVLRIQGVDILETKAAKADRKARKAAQSTNNTAPAPAHSGSAFMDGMSDNPVFN